MATDYGSDFAGFQDIGPTLREVSGPRCVAENVACRLITPRGNLWYAPSYGFDVRQFLSGHFKDTGSIVNGVVDQAEQEERVDSASAEVTFASEALTIKLSLVLAEGTFDFTISVDKVTGKMLLSEVV